MKYPRSWLQEYIAEPLPSTEELAERINNRAFELEEIVVLPNSEVILDFDIKPNRTHDAWSMLGMAREIAALFDLTFKRPEISYGTDSSVKSADMLSVSTDDVEFSPRLMKRMIVDLVVGPSPEWLRSKLEMLGQRSINNIVDITNFVMLETGQPIHAFDYDKLVGERQKEVRIRRAFVGERLTTLDGKEYELNPNISVWADSEKALDVAGIKGGAASAIDENTKRIMVSICSFNPKAIRNTSRSLGLVTDASKRFEQGLSPELPLFAMERTSTLIAEYAKGKVSEDVIDLYPRKRKPYRLGTSLAEINKLLGTTMTASDAEGILRRLNFSYTKVRPVDEIVERAKALVGVPYKYGASISYDAPEAFDCSSFVAYLFAGVGVSVPRMAVDQYVFGEEVTKEELQPGDVVFSDRGGDGTTEHIDFLDVDQVRTTSVSQDFLPGTKVLQGVDHNGIYLGDGKIVHASGKWYKGAVFIEDLDGSPAFKTIVGYRRLLQDTDERYVVVAPPERLDLIASRFLMNGNTADLIEEIGRVYGYENLVARSLTKEREPEINKTFYYSNKARDVLVSQGFSEVYTYSLAEKGTVALANPLASDKAYLRETLAGGLTKAIKQGIYNKDLLGIQEVKIFEIGTVFDAREHLALAFGAAGSSSARAACIEQACHALEESLGVKVTGGMCDGIYEVDFSVLLEKLPMPQSYADLAEIDFKRKMFLPISTYPFILRDIAVWITETDDRQQSTDKGSRDLEEIIKHNAGDLLARLNLFDTFTKEGRTSYAYHIVFQSNEKTLSDEEVGMVMKKIEDEIRERGWTVR